MFKADFPLRFPCIEDADEDFNKLESTSFLSLLKEGEWFSRSDFSSDLKIPQYIDFDQTGATSSNIFHAATRYACDSLNSPSVIRGWYEPKIRATLENSKFYETNPATALVLRKYLPSQFRPSAAKCIFEKYKPRSYYDPCGGWGDRLTAAMATHIPEIYVRDVNPLVFCGYTQQVNRYCPDDSIVKMELNGCENSIPMTDIDLIFTSPPYWKVEHYQGELQSFRKYKKFKNWLEDFLFVTIQNSLSALSQNGVFCLNVSDIYANHEYNKIIQPILDTFSSNCKGVMGYRMRKRMNSKSDNTGIFCEPMLILKK